MNLRMNENELKVRLSQKEFNTFYTSHSLTQKFVLAPNFEFSFTLRKAKDSKYLFDINHAFIDISEKSLNDFAESLNRTPTKEPLFATTTFFNLDISVEVDILSEEKRNKKEQKR